MAPTNRPDPNRPPLPEGHIYSKDGKPLSPLEQLSNLCDAICDDELFDKVCEEEWKGLSAEERTRHLAEVGKIEKTIRSWVEKIEVEEKRHQGKSPAS
jgi:hypothetical protein